VKKRIMFAYMGSFGLPICLFPFVIVYVIIIDPTWSGHPGYILGIILAPVGMLAGLIYSDIQRNIIPRCIVIRSLAALAVLGIFFYALLWLCEHQVFINNGWVLLPVAGPMLAAIVSEFVLRRRRMPQEAGLVHRPGLNGAEGSWARLKDDSRFMGVCIKRLREPFLIIGVILMLLTFIVPPLLSLLVTHSGFWFWHMVSVFVTIVALICISIGVIHIIVGSLIARAREKSSRS
jgi:hypothetical protein